MATPKRNPELVLRGKAHYAKILGDPVLNFSKDGKEWKMDLELINEGFEKELEAAGIADRVKNKEKYLDGAPHLSFKQKELKRNGSANDPIEVVDAAGNPWDQSKLIGNESIVDVKFVVVDYGKSMPKGVYIRKVRVLDLVPFENNDFEPLDENDEFYQKAVQAERDQAMLAMESTTASSVPFDTEDALDDDLPV